MPNATVNLSFAKGEVTPRLHARADLDFYRLAVKLLSGFLVPKTGGADRTPGTGFIDECRFPAKVTRRLPFIASAATGDSYDLEFGDLYMEVIRAGIRLTETPKIITAASQADPCLITSALHGFENGDDVILNDIVGMTELNGRRFRVANKTANDFQLHYTDGTNVDSTAFTAYVSGGTAARVYKIETPYTEAELPKLNWDQDGNVMTIVDGVNEIRELTRAGHTNWTLAIAVFGPKIDAPGTGGTGGNVVAGAGGSNSYRYQVTAIDNDTGEESLTGYELARSILSISQANPARVKTTANHGYETGDQVRIKSVGGMTQVNDKTFVIIKIDADEFDLEGIDSTGYTAYTAGGTTERPYFRVDSAAAPTPALPHLVTFSNVATARKYAVYREQNGVFGFVGLHQLATVPNVIPSTSTFKDIGTDVNTADTPPINREVFVGAGNYPSTVVYDKQRRHFSGIPNKPGYIESSRIGFYSNFTTHETTQDSDSLSIPINTKEQIRHLISLRRLLVLTGSSEGAIEGNADGVITPGQINAKTYTYEGTGEIRPLIVDNVVLFLQARGSIVREMSFDISSDSYKGPDRTLISQHLLRGRKVRDWCYQKTPNSIVWLVLSDGALLGLTYVSEQQVWSWHRHATDGFYEQCCSIPEDDGSEEGGYDAVYFTVRRVINGKTVRYVERLDRGTVDLPYGIEVRYTHSSLSFDGRQKGATSLTLSGGPPWTSDDELTLTASDPTFVSTDTDVDVNGKPYTEYWVKEASGKSIRCQVVAYTNSTVVTVKPHKTVPVELQGVATTAWARAIRKVGGLWHLEGKKIAAVGDGFVLANPNVPGSTIYTVAGGMVTFAKTHAVIHVGLPYFSDIETLSLKSPDGALAGKKKLVRSIMADVMDTATFWAGPKPPADDSVSPTKGLSEYKASRPGDDPEFPVPLRSQEFELPIEAEFNDNGRCFLRMVDPRPCTILSITPNFLTG